MTYPIISPPPETRVTNLDTLPRGAGCAYLEAIPDHLGGYVATKWRRKPPTTLPPGRVLLALSGSPEWAEYAADRVCNAIRRSLDAMQPVRDAIKADSLSYKPSR